MKYKKVLVIGSGGTGKTYAVNKLKNLGINAVDADSVYGLIKWVDESGKTVPWPENPKKEWFKKYEFIWDKDTLNKLLEELTELYLFGISDTAFEVTDLFDKVYYLTATPELIKERLENRNRENPMGKTEEQKQLLIEALEKTKTKAEKLNLTPIEASLSPEEIYQIIQ